MPHRIFDSREGLANASVVDHTAVIERNIEVHTHQHTVIAQRQIADGEFSHDGYPLGDRGGLLPPHAGEGARAKRSHELQALASDVVDQVPSREE